MYFSVIVPVYGVEPYLTKCLDSILAQSFSDFEVILVDDGSPDRCPEICDEYAQKDERIHVIHQKNGGLVSARQAGIRRAKSEYIIHVDSDDWLEPEYFNKAHTLCEQYGADVISFAVNYVDENHTRPDREMIPAGLYEGERLQDVYDAMLLTPEMKHMHYYVWGKVFKKESVLPFQLAVDPRIAMGEDVSCLIPTLLAAGRVYVSDEIVYNCRCHTSSMSRSFTAEHFRQIELGVRLLRSCAPVPGYVEAVDRYCAFMCFVLLAGAAACDEKQMPAKVRQYWCTEFDRSLQRARFGSITAKSKAALWLLKRKKIGLCYRFLKVCSRIKG